jgi:hypothetical protein
VHIIETVECTEWITLDPVTHSQSSSRLFVYSLDWSITV